jgi:hypothetical protein
MTRQYFGGIYRVLQGVKELLRPRAKFVLITGDSAHHGIRVPVTTIMRLFWRDPDWLPQRRRFFRSRGSTNFFHSFGKSLGKSSSSHSSPAKPLSCSTRCPQRS